MEEHVRRRQVDGAEASLSNHSGGRAVAEESLDLLPPVPTNVRLFLGRDRQFGDVGRLALVCPKLDVAGGAGGQDPGAKELKDAAIAARAAASASSYSPPNLGSTTSATPSPRPAAAAPSPPPASFRPPIRWLGVP
ncbi:hypothetical protein C4D60_Mb07t22070 [Musa balbisiana]|uniref:Uncharacterized protein n=1 Tax=Musa balbisiana TaxID=52838 RepID=A0A4S8JJL7_MUSBA|nr:hypothetical protein C4D60_Mb07t22070 [Musa balbisiana]